MLVSVPNHQWSLSSPRAKINFPRNSKPLTELFVFTLSMVLTSHTLPTTFNLLQTHWPQQYSWNRTSQPQNNNPLNLLVSATLNSFYSDLNMPLSLTSLRSLLKCHLLCGAPSEKNRKYKTTYLSEEELLLASLACLIFFPVYYHLTYFVFSC